MWKDPPKIWAIFWWQPIKRSKGENLCSFLLFFGLPSSCAVKLSPLCSWLAVEFIYPVHLLLPFFGDIRTKHLQPSNMDWNTPGSPGILQAFFLRMGLLKYTPLWIEQLPCSQPLCYECRHFWNTQIILCIAI